MNDHSLNAIRDVVAITRAVTLDRVAAGQMVVFMDGEELRNALCAACSLYHGVLEGFLGEADADVFLDQVLAVADEDGTL